MFCQRLASLSPGGSVSTQGKFLHKSTSLISLPHFVPEGCPCSLPVVFTALLPSTSGKGWLITDLPGVVTKWMNKLVTNIPKPGTFSGKRTRVLRLIEMATKSERKGRGKIIGSDRAFSVRDWKSLPAFWRLWRLCFSFPALWRTTTYQRESGKKITGFGVM